MDRLTLYTFIFNDNIKFYLVMIEGVDLPWNVRDDNQAFVRQTFFQTLDFINVNDQMTCSN